MHQTFNRDQLNNQQLQFWQMNNPFKKAANSRISIDALIAASQSGPREQQTKPIQRQVGEVQVPKLVPQKNIQASIPQIRQRAVNLGARNQNCKIIKVAINQKQFTVGLQAEFQLFKIIKLVQASSEATTISPILEGRSKVLSENLRIKQQQEKRKSSEIKQRVYKYFKEQSKIDFIQAIKEEPQLDGQFLKMLQENIQKKSFKQMKEKTPQNTNLCWQILYIIKIFLRIKQLSPNLTKWLNGFLIDVQPCSIFLSLYFLNNTTQLQKHQGICFQIIRYHSKMGISDYSQTCAKQNKIIQKLSSQLLPFRRRNYNTLFIQMFQKILTKYLENDDLQSLNQKIVTKFNFNQSSNIVIVIGNIILKIPQQIQNLLQYAKKIIKKQNQQYYAINIANLLNILQNSFQNSQNIDRMIRFVIQMNIRHEIKVQLTKNNKLTSYGRSVLRILETLTNDFVKQGIQYHLKFLEILIQLKEKMNENNKELGFQEKWKNYLIRIVITLFKEQKYKLEYRQLNLAIKVIIICLKNCDEVSENLILMLLVIVQSNIKFEDEQKMKSKLREVQKYLKEQHNKNIKMLKIKILVQQMIYSSNETIKNINQDQLQLYLTTLSPLNVYNYQQFQKIMCFFFKVINQFSSLKSQKTKFIGVFALKLVQFLKINNFQLSQLLYEPKMYSLTSQIIWSLYIYRVSCTRLVKKNNKAYNINLKQLFKPYLKYTVQISQQKSNIHKIIYCTQFLCLINVLMVRKVIDILYQDAKPIIQQVLDMVSKSFDSHSSFSSQFEKQLDDQFKIFYQKSIFEKCIPQELNTSILIEIIHKIALIKQYISFFVVNLGVLYKVNMVQIDKFALFLEFLWDNFIQKAENNKILVKIVNQYQDNIYCYNETDQLNKLLPSVNQKTIMESINYIHKNILLLDIKLTKRTQNIFNKLTVNISRSSIQINDL